MSGCSTLRRILLKCGDDACRLITKDELSCDLSPPERDDEAATTLSSWVYNAREYSNGYCCEFS